MQLLFQDCIAQMPNHEKASAATHWLVKRLPRGADKVMAAVGLGKSEPKAGPLTGWLRGCPGLLKSPNL
jgi:hypothetical protein